MSAARASPDTSSPRLYGRRRGHRLRQGRAEVLERLLPRLRLALPAHGRLDLGAAFGDAVKNIWLEIGFGAGEHLAAQAQARPDVGFIGCEPFVNGVAALLTQVEALELSNIRVFDDDARAVLDVLPDASLGRVFVPFPDPWPKKRHHKRRFITPESLDVLARVMAEGAELRFASDHGGYVDWALEHLTRHPDFAWTARRAGDWRCRPTDGFPTRYEEKALEKGIRPVYLTFVRGPRRP